MHRVFATQRFGCRINADLRLGEEVMDRVDELARFSASFEGLTRLYLSPQHRAAVDLVAEWMTEAGMPASVDAVGNVVGRYEGQEPGLPALLLGSHLDSVRNGGKYDGTLGVLAAIACVKRLEGRRLPFAIEVFGFGDEEGVRFPCALTGSSAVAGTLERSHFDVSDADGVVLSDALIEFGGDPDKFESVARNRADVLGYVEVHIEQGPVLENEGIPVGVVTSIAGASRFAVSVTGSSGHAGTVPMSMREDALAAAAEVVLDVERRCRGQDHLVGTVGQMNVEKGAPNVIPGTAHFSIDIRSPDDEVRKTAIDDIGRSIEAIGSRRRVRFDIRRTYEYPSCLCSAGFIEHLEAAVAHFGIKPHQISSGAGHDAMVLGELTRVGMLFVRCKGGISHAPEESISVQDVDTACRVLNSFVDALATAGET